MSSCICADGIVVPCERETHTHTQILDIIETISESCATQTHYFSTIDFYFSPPTNRKTGSTISTVRMRKRTDEKFISFSTILHPVSNVFFILHSFFLSRYLYFFTLFQSRTLSCCNIFMSTNHERN